MAQFTRIKYFTAWCLYMTFKNNNIFYIIFHNGGIYVYLDLNFIYLMIVEIIDLIITMPIVVNFLIILIIISLTSLIHVLYS